MEAQRHKSDYEEPSEAELLNYIHHIPLEHGMKQHLQPFILNMSLE